MISSHLEHSEEAAVELTEEIEDSEEENTNDFRIIDSQRVSDHPASAGFRYRRALGNSLDLTIIEDLIYLEENVGRDLENE